MRRKTIDSQGAQKGTPPVRFRTIAVIALVLAAGYLALDQYASWHNRYAGELARRTQCAANLREIYSALEAYRAERGHLPDELDALAEEGYVDASTLFCPNAKELHTGPYTYFPDHWSDAGSILVTESLVNHADLRVRVKELSPEQFALFGDGHIENVWTGEARSQAP